MRRGLAEIGSARTYSALSPLEASGPSELIDCKIQDPTW